MLDLIQRLMDRGLAYAADGDVYFDVAGLPSYGSLSGQRVDEMQPAGDSVGDTRKREPRDFALWKGHKPGEPETASWPSPWGPGRPGWHLECSAMATKYLGASFDIHGGGLDLVFPHHENELAQSQRRGDGFAQYWMHNGLLTMAGEKMSKSLGNTLQVTEVIKHVAAGRASLLPRRGALPVGHGVLPDALGEAGRGVSPHRDFLERASRVMTADAGGVVCAEFAEALDNDLSVPCALAAIHNIVREGNAALAEARHDALRGVAVVGARDDGVLGITRSIGRRSRTSDLTGVVDALVRVALDQRTAARGRKDYAAADAIRDELSAAGIVVEDTPDGPRWTLKTDEQGLE